MKKGNVLVVGGVLCLYLQASANMLGCRWKEKERRRKSEGRSGIYTHELFMEERRTKKG